MVQKIFPGINSFTAARTLRYYVEELDRHDSPELAWKSFRIRLNEALERDEEWARDLAVSEFRLLSGVRRR